MQHGTFLLKLTAFFLLSSSLSVLMAGDTRYEIERIENNAIHLRSSGGGGKTVGPLRTDLRDLKPIGVLHSTQNGAAPVVLVSGMPCDNCSHAQAVYAFPLNGGTPSLYVYPGRILDAKTRAVVFESRAFFGRCLRTNPNEIYLAWQKDRVDRRRGLQPSVLVVEPGTGHIEEKLLERGFPRLQDTLALVKKKQCQEISGRNRLMSSKPLDLRTRNANPNRGITVPAPVVSASPVPSPAPGAVTGDDDDAEEDDTPTKENQTDKELPSEP